MARQAVNRYAALRVTGEAKAHIHIHESPGGGFLGHIAMTSRTGHVRADVRRMIEKDVRRGTVVVHAHPGNIFAAIFVGCQLLNLGPVRGDDLMAGHAKLHVRNCGFGAGIHADMAGLAFESFGEMHLVRVGNRLYWLERVLIQIVADGIERGGMGGSVYAGIAALSRLRGLRCAGCE
jgi:hypothetical protein